jgi:hypothetical protein
MKRSKQTCLALALMASAFALPARSETVECIVISAIPITISAQGVYCLKSNLAASLPSGAMITIATNNVSIDFNGYKLGGQAAGPATTASGISANGQLNVVVRNGSVRGFRRGIEIVGGSGHLIEGMTFDANTQAGIYLSSVQNAIARGNRVVNTGGTAFATDTYGIYADGSDVRVLDNDVSDTSRNSGNVNNAFGIRVFAFASIFDGNRVTNSGDYGIYSSNNLHLSISGNRIHNSATTGVIGVRTNTGPSICRDNTVTGFTTAFDCSSVVSGNLSF